MVWPCLMVLPQFPGSTHPGIFLASYHPPHLCANSTICVISGLRSMFAFSPHHGWYFSGVLSLSACLVIFEWIQDIINFTFLAATPKSRRGGLVAREAGPRLPLVDAVRKERQWLSSKQQPPVPSLRLPPTCCGLARGLWLRLEAEMAMEREKGSFISKQRENK